MRLVVQRVKSSTLTVEGKRYSQIENGFLVLVGVGEGDTVADGDVLAEKLVNLRVFADEAGKMNLSLLDTGGAALLVSQFTLYADCRKGRRPSFNGAAAPSEAEALYKHFVKAVAERGAPVATGVFGAHMQITLTNDGPVTLVIEARDGTIC